MALRGLGRSALEAWEVPRDLLLARYPAFVTGGPLARGEVPVFVFHGAEPESFARQLDHLARNGYVTLSIDDYVGRPAGNRLAARASGAAHLRRRARLGVERRGAVPEAARDAGRRLPGAGAGAVAPAGARLGRRRGRPCRCRCGTVSRAGRALAPVVGGDRCARAGRPRRVPEPHAAPRAHPHRAGARRLRHPAYPDGLRRLRSAARSATPSGTCWGATSRSARRFSFRRRARPMRSASSSRRSRAARASTPSRRRAARPSSSVPAGRARCERWPDASPRGAASRPATSRRPRSVASSPKRAGRSRSERAGASCTSATPGTWRVPLARRLAEETGYETAFCGKVRGVPLTRPGGDLAPDRPARRGLRGAASREGPREPDRAPAAQVGPPLRRRAGVRWRPRT